MFYLFSKYLRAIYSLLAFFLIITSLAEAQTNTENFAQFEFNFNNPGARATGIGGAFISVADDATAAEANPAGLTVLIRPEISFEIKGIEFTQSVNAFSHTGTIASFSPQTQDFKSSVTSPAFASFVLPIQRVTLSAFRYEMVNYNSEFFTRGAYIPNYPGDTAESRTPLRPVKSSIKMEIVNWGGAIAYKFNEKLSAGFSLGVAKINVTSLLNRYNIEVFDESTLASSASIDDSGSKTFFNVGVLVKPSDKLSIGGIFKKRPHFELEHNFSFDSTTERKDINFNVPSSLGLGISYRATDALTFAFDAVRINYSSLTDDFVLTISEEDGKPEDYAVGDVTELHFGAEYVTFLGSTALVFRGGFFTEPENRIHWLGETTSSDSEDRQELAAVERFLFQEGDSDFHLTFGLGFVLMQNFQIDFAGNLSDGSDEGVASLVFRF